MSKSNEFKSRVYTERPAYADLDAPAKFDAIQGIIATRLRQYPSGQIERKLNLIIADCYG